jgi:hypothetical protein
MGGEDRDQDQGQLENAGTRQRALAIGLRGLK